MGGTNGAGAGLLAELREAAREAGLDLLGATSAETLPLPEDDWWNHDQPRDLMADARSVVVAGFCVRYEPRVVESEPGRPRGWFPVGGARVFEQMESHCWKVVGDFLRQRGYEAVPAPRIPIKPAIVRSGLGNYGKHGVVITPEFGSMIMWGATVTNAPLVDAARDANVFAQICPPDCTLCIDACPTEALPGDYTLLRDRCITLWLWGSFSPRELREQQRNRLFACGECLKACPANASIPVRPASAYPVPVDPYDDSPELLPLVADDFDYYLAHIPTFPRQAGRETMRASAVVALGNSGDSTIELEPLADALRADETRLRCYAAWTLGRIGGPAGRSLLQSALASESDAEVRAEIEAALG